MFHKIKRSYHIPTEQLYALCKTSKIELRREIHLNLFMFKQRGNLSIINRRPVNTRAHDALLFNTTKPNNEKYKHNIFYRGAIAWNGLPASERNLLVFDKFKDLQKKKLM